MEGKETGHKARTRIWRHQQRATLIYLHRLRHHQSWKWRKAVCISKRHLLKGSSTTRQELYTRRTNSGALASHSIILYCTKQNSRTSGKSKLEREASFTFLYPFSEQFSDVLSNKNLLPPGTLGTLQYQYRRTYCKYICCVVSKQRCGEAITSFPSFQFLSNPSYVSTWSYRNLGRSW